MAPSLPETMTAIAIPEAGGPEALQPVIRSVPQPGAGEVLIKVDAAGINRPDVLQRQGGYPPPEGASDIPGLEIAGRVVAHGPDVIAPELGAEVCALVTGGGYAEYCVAPVGQCLPYPADFDAVAAAALPETFFTVYSNVMDRGGLQAGERFLVHGGSSGIGTTAIQMARAFGAEVFATAGSDEKCRICAELGAKRAINYRTEDFVGVVKSETGGRGADLILDMVGGDYIPRNIKALGVEGRLVFIGFLGGPKAEVNFAPVMLKRLHITGSTLRARDVAFKADVADKLRKTVWPRLASGEIRVLIHQTFPLAEASAAHALMESSTHIGKIVLRL
jgi:putative PIG3 family NAD(P)H quinone oxidoreductase